jgi:transposase
VVEDRKETSVKALFTELNGQEQQPQIERVNIDMWKPYRNVMKQVSPDALQVHDKFHLVKKLSEGIDKTRRNEVKIAPILLKQRYTVLKNAENRTAAQEQAFKHICGENLKTAEAWFVRENFKSIFSFEHWQDKLYIYEQWLEESLKRGLKYINPVLETFKRHYQGIKNAIVTGTSSGKHENINGQIQAVLAKSSRFKNFNRFKINIMFYFGGLEMIPLKFD